MMPEPRPDTLYFIYRTDRKVFLGGAKQVWRSDPKAYLVFSDPKEAEQKAAELRAQGHDCSVELLER